MDSLYRHDYRYLRVNGFFSDELFPIKVLAERKVNHYFVMHSVSIKLHVQGAFLAWERVLARRGERGKTPVAARIPSHAVLLQAQCRPNAAPCRLFATQTPLLAVLLQAKCCRIPSFHRSNAAACRLSTAQMQLRGAFLQPKRIRPPSFRNPNAAARRLFASFNVHKFSIWTTDDIALRYSLTCYNVFTYQNSGKNVSVGPRDMFATCCFFLTSTNMVQCNQSC